MEPSRPRPRTIRIEDVVKALDIIAQRLGDGDRSCERLQAWAAEGRVTPAGQRLTPEAVAEGIQLWRAKAEPEAADRPPPTPLSSRRPSKREATQAGTSQAKEADARPDDRPKRRRRLKIMEESEPAAHSVDVAVDREACRAPPSFAERQAERKQREARLEELAETRFQELLAEIQGHMCEILRRSSSEALQEFRESTLTDPSERRELYMRLVHRQQAELRAPMQGLLPHQAQGIFGARQVEGMRWDSARPSRASPCCCTSRTQAISGRISWLRPSPVSRTGRLSLSVSLQMPACTCWRRPKNRQQFCGLTR
ncbi:unnamed protein product [Effrenium voratum]|nr:unnamed protein product [Effrenium voratum]